MQLLFTLLNLKSEIFSTFAIALFNFVEITELLFIELSKTGRRYLQVLEIYSCARAYLRGRGFRGVQTPPPPPKFSDFFLKSEGKEVERKKK